LNLIKKQARKNHLALSFELGKGYSQVQANDDMISLNRRFSIDWEHAYVKSEKVTKYANKWCRTFFKSLKNS